MTILTIFENTTSQFKIDMQLKNLPIEVDCYIYIHCADDFISVFKEQQPKLLIIELDIYSKDTIKLLKIEIVEHTPIIFINTNKKYLFNLDAIKALNCVLLNNYYDSFLLQSNFILLQKIKQHYDAYLDEMLHKQIFTHLIKSIEYIKLLELLQFNKIEEHILKEKWFKQKSFTDIGKSMNMTGQAIIIKYNSALKKLRTKLLHFKKANIQIEEFKKNRTKFNKTTKTIGNFDLPVVFEKDYMNLHIDDLVEIPTKYRNVLKEREIVRLGDLTKYTFKQIALMKHLGEGSATMIQRTMAKFGLKFKE